MRSARNWVRLGAIWLSAAIFTLILLPIFSEFFIELARVWGLYERPAEKVGGVMGLLIDLISSYAFAVGASLIIGLTIGLWIDWLLSQPRITRVFPKFNKELLNLAFASTPPFIIDVPYVNENSYSRHSGFLKTIRVKAVNDGGETITGCKAYLTSISKKLKNGEWEEIFSDRIPLEWGFEDNEVSDGVDIPPESHHFILVAQAASETNEFQAKTIPNSLRIFNIIYTPNTYRFCIRVHAEREINTKPICIDVYWERDWETLTANLARDKSR